MLVGTDSSGQTVADKGEQIYQDLYQDTYEKKYSGQYVVIEVQTKHAYVADSAAGAAHKAEAEDPDGLFHLIKIQGSAPKGINFYLMKLMAFARRVGDIKLP
ncbi:MAG: hypothetical protein QM706_16010 [Nitrospira sp.]